MTGAATLPQASPQAEAKISRILAKPGQAKSAVPGEEPAMRFQTFLTDLSGDAQGAEPLPRKVQSPNDRSDGRDPPLRRPSLMSNLYRAAEKADADAPSDAAALPTADAPPLSLAPDITRLPESQAPFAETPGALKAGSGLGLESPDPSSLRLVPPNSAQQGEPPSPHSARNAAFLSPGTNAAPELPQPIDDAVAPQQFASALPKRMAAPASQQPAPLPLQSMQPALPAADPLGFGGPPASLVDAGTARAAGRQALGIDLRSQVMPLGSPSAPRQGKGEGDSLDLPGEQQARREAVQLRTGPLDTDRLPSAPARPAVDVGEPASTAPARPTPVTADESGDAPSIRTPAKVTAQETHFEPVRPAALQQIADRIVDELPRAPEPSPATRPSAPGLFTPAAQGNGPLRVLQIQLEPVELGTVQATMRLVGDRLEITLEASRSETADLLRQDREALSTMLRSAGYSLDNATIQVAELDRTQVQLQPSAPQSQAAPSGTQSGPQSGPQSQSGSSPGGEGSPQGRSQGQDFGDQARNRGGGSEASNPRRDRSGIYL